MPDPAIETRGLTKRFGSITAVDRLDLAVHRGEVFGFLGPNGAGKTTTIRLLLGFINPTAGSSLVFGRPGADPAARRRIGYLPADLAFDPRYTTSDLIDFFGSLRGGYDHPFTAALLERFALDPSRPIGDLSTGNRRKVGIVQAFMHRPDLYILDEPTSGLDPLLQQEFQRLVREEVARGATVFLSSHVLPEVEALASRVGILRRGRLVTVAAIDELRRKARQRIDIYTAGPPPRGLFEQLPGVRTVSYHDSGVHLVVEGAVDAVIKAAAGLTVERIHTPGQDLEDLFLEYYQGGGA
ncbi:ABC transporter ATP-binding protein [Tepidiforma thermophila]|uniref:ABC-2 type transport system ATP-binding protein n=1 Tax=Tepidiforma thermophila (strain KCTC 52669 / CGMCC 1.13589 / G233) TaxID=2761530 RepID=A0A2A9HJI5_TEPT2|nr:ABC transporter ATP-binding protein [Tepidiforma thermophila]PFG75019.1 ABC-2 type transport system ATP-binding protein [Tepidiforma thermophila]